MGKSILAQETPPEFNLQGAVKEITETFFIKGEPVAFDSTTYMFSGPGVLIQEIDNKNPEYSCRFITIYDKMGNILSKKCPGCQRASEWINSYNELGLLTRTKTQQWRQSNVYSYNDQNQLTQMMYTDSSDLRGSVYRRIMSYKYDEFGNEIVKITIEQKTPDSDFDTTLVKLMKYNAVNRRKESYIYGSSYGIPVLYFRFFTYDLEGNLICEVQKYNDTTHQSNLDTTYSNTEFVLKIRTNQARLHESISEHKSEFEYDIYGNITLEKKPTFRRKYKYSYDAQGNWIEKRCKGKFGSRTQRIITYYK